MGLYQKVKNTRTMSQVDIVGASINGNKAEVTVMMSFHERDWATVPVKLIEEHGTWKIYE